MPIQTPNADKYKLTASNLIRLYVWDKLQAELGWNKNETGGLIPITIPSQQPEFNAFSAPYIVYRWSLISTGEMYPLKEEQIVFNVYSDSEEEIRTAVNLLDNCLSRYDDSAREINTFICGGTKLVSELNEQGEPSLKGVGVSAATTNPLYKKIDIKYTYVMAASGPDPALSEGGRMDGTITVRVAYTVESDGMGLRS